MNIGALLACKINDSTEAGHSSRGCDMTPQDAKDSTAATQFNLNYDRLSNKAHPLGLLISTEEIPEVTLMKKES